MAILLTNDDGIDAPGLAALAEALAGLDDLIICAPETNRSGVGSSITLGRPLRAERRPDGANGVPRRAVDGNPADAVKFGLQHMAKERPALVVSGINPGFNIGFNIRNSGTLGAAFEAAESGVPALAVSTGWLAEPDFRAARHFARMLAEKMLALPPDREPFVLNLNVPAGAPEDVRDLVFTRAGLSGYNDVLIPCEGEEGRYRLTNQWMSAGANSDCDGAVDSGYAVATPLRVNMTDDELMSRLCGEWNIQEKTQRRTQ